MPIFSRNFAVLRLIGVAIKGLILQSCMIMSNGSYGYISLESWCKNCMSGMEHIYMNI